MLSNPIFLIAARSTSGFRKARGSVGNRRPRGLRGVIIHPMAPASLSQATGLNVRRGAHPWRDNVIFLSHTPHNPVIAVLQHFCESQTNKGSLVPAVLKSPREILRSH